MPEEDVVPSGYDREEEYFHEREHELLEELQRKRAASAPSREAEPDAHPAGVPRRGSLLARIKRLFARSRRQ